MNIEEKPELSQVLETAIKAGRIMLENGAEIYRVEDTMKRICAQYGHRDDNFFVLSNGIFTSVTDIKEKQNYAHIEHIPVHGADLSKVIAVNQLSREICSNNIPIDEANRKLDEIINTKPSSKTLQVFATALGASCFAILLDGSLFDGFLALISGFVLGLFMVFISNKYLSKITGNLLGAAVVTIVCLILNNITTVPTNMTAMIAGSIIPLVPGVAFVNGIRDIGDGDYISGAVRLLDAILVFICIATGVGVTLALFAKFFGGFVV